MDKIDKESMFPAANVHTSALKTTTHEPGKSLICSVLSDPILLFRQLAHYSFMFRF